MPNDPHHPGIPGARRLGLTQLILIPCVLLLAHSGLTENKTPPPTEHWAFQPVTRPPVPTVNDSSWCRNEIDHFILARLESRNWRPAPDATPTALIRRVHLDVLGLPPALSEQAEDRRALLEVEDEEGWTALIDQLLARPAYGERWARHWLDLVRYADSNGYERDAAKPFVWRYRDWVIRSFNDDKPMDQFILEQIAGDEIPDATAETMIATGFYRLGHWDDEPADPAADRFDQLDDMLRTTSEVFLGLTLACARCHDHKFEPLSTRDYYAMVAIFNPLERPRNGRAELTLPAGSAKEFAALQERDQNIATWRQENEQTKQALTQEFLRSKKCRFPAETARAWLAEPGNRTDNQNKLVSDSKSQLETELQAFLPEKAREQIHKNEDRINAWLTRRPDLTQGYFLHEPNPSPAPSHVLLRGSPHQLGAEVSPAVPAVLVKEQPEFPPPNSRTSQRRLGLARWMVAPDNPLTARVLVNRVWQQHFGAGLVRTPSDFGVMGEAPTHPELLDWLTHWFVRDAQWSLKKLHHLILTSRTWRMSRTPRADYAAADPDNRLLSYLSYRRLEVEAIRDSMLAISGRLQPNMYGPPMFPVIPEQALEANTDKQSIWTASPESERSRRTIYAFIKRGLVVPMLEVMDLADTVHTCPQRQVTTVAPQALTLFNGSFVNEQARHLARRLKQEAGADSRQQIELAWRLALCRSPRAAEMESMIAFLEKETVAARVEDSPKRSEITPEEKSLIQFCRVLLNLNEFVYPD